MSSLLTDSEKSSLTGILGDHFDTFKENIVVYQKPIKTASDINIDFLYGYGPISNATNYSYTQVSGVFSALVNRGQGQSINEHDTISQPNINIPDRLVTIKVEEATKNYLKEATVESVKIQNKTYNLASSDNPVHFLTKTYYVFELRETD